MASAQPWLLGDVLGLITAAGSEQLAKRTPDTMWALHRYAARQSHTREGHLNVPGKHVEHPRVGGAERHAALDALGMRR
ncbi:hypothetical protein ACWGH2_25490 [Streptomyces sp. NPDC054871]